MGAWGYKNFENDTAAGWFIELEKSPYKELILPYLIKVLEENEFVDDEESIISLAVMEALSGRLKLINTEFILPFIDEMDMIVLIEASIKAGKKILFFKEHSEVRELWAESDEYRQWFDYQVYLIKKLENYYMKYDFIDRLSVDEKIEEEWKNYLKINYS